MILFPALRQARREEIRKERKPLLAARKKAREQFQLDIATAKAVRDRALEEADEKFDTARDKIVLKYERKQITEAKKRAKSTAAEVS